WSLRTIHVRSKGRRGWERWRCAITTRDDARRAPHLSLVHEDPLAERADVVAVERVRIGHDRGHLGIARRQRELVPFVARGVADQDLALRARGEEERLA